MHMYAQISSICLLFIVMWLYLFCFETSSITNLLGGLVFIKDVSFFCKSTLNIYFISGYKKVRHPVLFMSYFIGVNLFIINILIEKSECVHMNEKDSFDKKHV